MILAAWQHWITRFRRCFNGTATLVVELDVDHETTSDWVADRLEQIADYIRHEGLDEHETTLTNANGFEVGSYQLV